MTTPPYANAGVPEDRAETEATERAKTAAMKPPADTSWIGTAHPAAAGWVRRKDDTLDHACAPPTGSFGGPLGERGDLWRCHCGALWRVGLACPACEAYGGCPHRGQCVIGLAWRPATWWQRLRYWRRRGEQRD